MSHPSPVIDRRKFLAATAATTLGAAGRAGAQERPEAIRTAQRTHQVLHPQMRVPVSFIIDDSTCLVNMGHFCTPQFATAHPGRAEYDKPWRSWPREIPDSFVREFGEWCAENGVRGKYSVVPCPALVGWVDRELPGWSRRELQDSLKLVRELMVPHWDIHPEMITHTRVIDLKTGRPFDEINKGTMENSYPQEDKSVDELAAYLAYALRILKNCDLPCEGITTPGGFGNRVKDKLPMAVDQAVRDVYGVELPHYFKYIFGGEKGTEPVLEAVRGRDTDAPQMTVNVPAGTGDWYGGWQGDLDPQPDRYLTEDGQSGALAELISKGQPATFLCHWPGMYCNGDRHGFHAFQRNVRTVNEVHGDKVIWMKLSEIGRYWAAKELTTIQTTDDAMTLEAPIGTERFTVQVEGSKIPSHFSAGEDSHAFAEVGSAKQLKPGHFVRQQDSVVLCFDLPKGSSQVTWA
ncbi:hypothetical protein [Roseiconus nitratireducens]|uniref:hypothetical protein n=1 Tax=Roseiconus nitratireducens TaxID=2605748 RepID=UPI001F4707A0|nr:hypothetical protein [Roseiconus nitratireducens]